MITTVGEPSEIFSQFVTETSPWALRLAYGMTGHRTEAEDLVQETYTRYWVRFRQQRVPLSNAYLYRAIMNACYSWHRARYTRTSPRRDDGGSVELESDLALRDLIMRLPRAERDAATAVFVLGWSHEATSRALRLKPGTLRARLARARKALEKAYYDDTLSKEKERKRT